MTIDQEALRRRFNPEGSLIRRQQDRMTEMLKVLDGICQKHQIKYWICAGTLLGQVRHGGYIPQDDDLDVEMLREDYLRLMEILPAELPDHLALQTPDTDENYFFGYAKLRDLKSHVTEVNRYDRIFKYHVNIYRHIPHGKGCTRCAGFRTVRWDSATRFLTTSGSAMKRLPAGCAASAF